MTEEFKHVQYNGKAFSIAIKSSGVADEWLIFLHGIGCAKECFDEVFSTNLAQRFSILTFDFVGFGSSDKPKDFSYTLEEHAAITQLLIEQFSPKKITLVAHSMGGTIGTLLAGQLKSLDRFINLEGNLVSEDAGIVSRRTAEQTEENFIRNGFDKFLESLRSSSDNSFRAWADWYAKSDKIAIHRSGSSLVNWSDSGELLKLFNSLPKKAFMYGEKADVTKLIPQFKDVDVFSISNSGHFMMLDNSKEFYALLSDYV
jgi:pimeloyl-ACP methyl ester carboxylesterase